MIGQETLKILMKIKNILLKNQKRLLNLGEFYNLPRQFYPPPSPLLILLGTKE